jgi:hypothetical protein
MAWVLFWDDDDDCGSLTQDNEKAEANCNNTIRFIQSHLHPNLGIKPLASESLHKSEVLVLSYNNLFIKLLPIGRPSAFVLVLKILSKSCSRSLEHTRAKG